MAEVLEDMQKQLKQPSKFSQKSSPPTKHGDENTCPKCNDKELVFYKVYIDEDDKVGTEWAKPCECSARKEWQRRFKSSMVPDEFVDARLDNFKMEDATQHLMHEMVLDYLRHFAVKTSEDGRRIKKFCQYNFGFLAEVGETKMREMNPTDRAELKKLKNNFGIGKTHLQMALAKKLVKDGFNVLVVSDVTFIDDLMQARKSDDNNETYSKLLDSALKADVLIWDDIGKVSNTEPRERMYYTIINERSKINKPIVFNSNEDRSSLAEKIGYAGASRLFGGCEQYLLEASGKDMRFKGSGV